MHPAAAKKLFEASVGRWPSDLAENRGWILHKAEFPIVDCEFRKAGLTPLRVRMDCSNWDEKPPSVLLCNSAGEPLKQLPNKGSDVFNGGAHKATGLPFICMAGSLEFHTHESHLNERWEQFREKPGFDIGEILDKLWRAWQKGWN